MSRIFTSTVALHPGSGVALGAVLDFRDDLYLFNRVFDIAQNTLFMGFIFAQFLIRRYVPNFRYNRGQIRERL